ncbi:hypothetical protein [Pediococcus acidilactici]|nr:hypothetical protein [Pediococcus acidilactici]
MTNPIIDLQKTQAVNDDGKEVLRHSTTSFLCLGTSSASFLCG